MIPVQSSGPKPVAIPETPSVDSKDSKQTSTPTPSLQTAPLAKSESGGAEMKAEHSMRGSQIAADLERKINPNAPPLEYIEKGGAVARSGQSGGGVAHIQRALNRDGATPPLVDNGKFDDKTETAVREYQKKNLLPTDGRVGEETLKHLLPNADSVEKDPRFATLDSGVRKEISDRIRKNPNDLEMRAGLKEVATAPGFENLAPAQQREMLGVLDQAPKDKALADNLSKMAGSENFRKLDPSVQSLGLNQLSKHANDPVARGTLLKLQTMPGFQKLDSHKQERLLTQNGGKNEIISKPSREALDKVMKGWTDADDPAVQAKQLDKFLVEQNRDEWKTPAGAWNGRTTAPDSTKGPESIPPGKLDMDKSVAAEKYVLTYGTKEIPVYVPQGTSPDKIKETLGALSKAERDLITEVKVEPKDDGKNSLFDANADTGVIRAFPEGLAMAPSERQKSALVHEAAHLIDGSLGKTDSKWDSTWTKAMDDDILTTSQRAKHGLDEKPKDTREDFAEAYLTYRLVKGTPQEAEFRAMFPNRWELIDNMDKKTAKLNPEVSH